MDSKLIEVTLAATLTGHQNPIFALALDLQRNKLFSGGNDKGVVEWDLTSFSFKRVLCKVGASVYSLLRIPDSPWLAIGLRSGEVLIVDIDEQSLKARLNTQSGAVFSIQYIPGKKELIAIGEEGTAYVWTLDGFQQLYRFKVSDTTVRTIAISEDAKQLAFGDKNGWVYLYAASDFQPMQRQAIHTMPVTSLLFNRGSLLSGGRDAKLFRLHPKTLHVEQDLVPHMFTVYGLEAGNRGELIASASRDKTLKIWDYADLRLVKNISRDRGYDSHLLSINTLLWQDNYIFTASDDKTIRVWKVAI